MTNLPRIKHVRDLPKWFKIEKYDEAKKLDAGGWQNNLYERFMIRGGIFKKVATPLHERQRRHVIELFEKIKEKPILTERRVKFRVNAKPVEFITPESLRVMCRKIGWPENDTLQELLELGEKLDESEEAMYRKHQPIVELMNSPEAAPVIIDMRFPDEILIESFARWLKETRRRYEDFSGGKRARQKNFDLWVSSGILPYLDLNAWSILEGVEIPDRLYADAVFPDGDGGEDRVRKTTKKIAKELMDFESILSLASMDAHDQSRD